jgi:broad specificity phosphatase PhoE
MTIYLVRHGRAANAGDGLDPGLDELGHTQAAAAAAVFRGLKVGRLLVSPLRRTRETAIPIAEVTGLEAEICEAVAEVFDPSWPAERRRQMIGPFMAATWAEYPELQAWRTRVVEAVVGAGEGADAAGHDLVVVSHYIAIGVAIGEALGDDRVVPVAMANAAITRLELGEGGLTLIEAASTAHLAPEQVTGGYTAIAGR